MKQIILTVLTFFVLSVQSADAMSYERAASEARFLTDKMAYELNLDDYQYQRAYEINFNYFYNLNDASEFYGNYWRTRTSALRVILSALQFRNFCRLNYFYRPITLYRNTWIFPIHRRYPRNRFFRPKPPRPARLPRPRRDFRFESAGQTLLPRSDYNRPHNSRPDFRPDNNRNDFLPSGRDNYHKNDSRFQRKDRGERNYQERNRRR